jgi:hypothetical protein
MLGNSTIGASQILIYLPLVNNVSLLDKDLKNRGLKCHSLSTYTFAIWGFPIGGVGAIPGKTGACKKVARSSKKFAYARPGRKHGLSRSSAGRAALASTMRAYGVPGRGALGFREKMEKIGNVNKL